MSHLSNQRNCEEGEPPRGAFVTDSSGHSWKRDKRNGWWYCSDCRGAGYPHGIRWSWRDVLEDCSGELTIREPVL